ncbi:unnamed protein product [Lampetra planeri]
MANSERPRHRKPGGSRGGGSQVHAGTPGGQSRHTASSQSDAAFAGPSSNTASSRLRRRTVHVVDQAIAAFGTESELDEDDDTAALQQRLPVFREFSSTGGDWAAFQRRFLSHQEMVGWSDAQALRALPATLDDDSLAALISIPKRQRATLQAALQRLSDVYGPPSATRHQFYERRCKPRESPLAFRTALLAMARAAYPRMDDEAAPPDPETGTTELPEQRSITRQVAAPHTLGPHTHHNTPLTPLGTRRMTRGVWPTLRDHCDPGSGQSWPIEWL